MLEMDFLDQDYWDYANEFFGLSEPIIEAFHLEIDRINRSPELQRLAWELHRRLYDSDESVQEMNARLLGMGPEEGMFAAVVYASGLPSLIDKYNSRGIPLHILKDTLSDLEIWMNHHRQKYGVWGLSELGWLVWHFRGGIFRLGRLQFLPNSYNEKVKVFRNRANGSVVALSDDGVKFSANGQKEDDHKWTSILEHDGDVVKGNKITPNGTVDREPMELSMKEWELVLEEGDRILEVHIPEGSKMTYELCKDSYRQAKEFAATYLPDQNIKAFTCTSWLLSPQLRQILPESSNIVKFQSDYYCTTLLPDDTQMFERVFGMKLDDLSNAPHDTSLRRALLDYVADGNSVRGGAGFILW
ncbi:acyltransferase domain-containing protein [Bacillus niameyensis]|uniref:acyltransferase domain-containing protein n=1 Tax=Bacillus niameyensis TaxID=1522308 RepID=UPI0007847CD2|nr:acyltransferase domain-containing protein [Bacillus niameyensis]